MSWDFLPNYVTVPEEPTEAMLRPFYECPPDELKLAWAAMIAIVKADQKRHTAAERTPSEEKP